MPLLSKYVYNMPTRMSLTFVLRRSQPIVLGFPSPYIYIRQCPFLEQILWPLKERNGRSTEKYLLRHSQRYVPSRTSHGPEPFIDPEYHFQKNNKLVWDETIQIMMDLFENVWGSRSELVVGHCVDITLPVCFPWLKRSCSSCFTTPVSISSQDCTFHHQRCR